MPHIIDAYNCQTGHLFLSELDEETLINFPELRVFRNELYANEANVD
jgi:hypothetical protein